MFTVFPKTVKLTETGATFLKGKTINKKPEKQ